MLYEVITSGGRRRKYPLLLRGIRKRGKQGQTGRDNPFFYSTSSVSGLLWLYYQRIYFSGGCMEIRITSYNVCYTKLLRPLSDEFDELHLFEDGNY